LGHKPFVWKLMSTLFASLNSLSSSLLTNLQDAILPDIVEFAPRLVICGFPGGQHVPNAHPERSLRALESPGKLKLWLDKHFPTSQFVVWNLSGLAYDYDVLGGKVVVYSFPAHPVPPLEALVEIASSVHDWLQSDESNVAVLHDISGRRYVFLFLFLLLVNIIAVHVSYFATKQTEDGANANATTRARRDARSAVVGACAQQLGLPSPRKMSLETIVLPLGHMGRALVPSQHRFFRYFCSTVSSMDGKAHIPEPRPLVLARVIVNGIPDFSLAEPCRPVLRVLDAHKVIGGSSPNFSVTKEDLSFSLSPVSPCPDLSQGPYSPTTVCGDVLLRVYHSRPPSDELITMFAVAFHTSFVPDLALRFKAAEIDGG